jgi:hypothetical protein
VVLAVDGAQRPVGGPWLFGPGAPVELQLGPEAARLVVLTFADGVEELLRCGVTLAGPRAALPAPALAFRSSPLQDGALTFSPLTEPPTDLRYADCEPTPDPCPSLATHVMRIPGFADRTLDTMTLTATGAILMSTGAEVEGPRALALVGDAFEPYEPPVGLTDLGFRNLVGTPEGVWVTQGPQAWLVAGSGRVVRTATAPFWIEGLAVDPTGPVLAFNDQEEAGGGLVGLVDLAGLVPSIPEVVLGAVAAGPGATFALTPSGVEVLRPGGWATERAFAVTEGWQIIGGDAEAQALGNVVGEVLLRSPDGAWSGAPLPASLAFKIRVILSLGGGRLAVAGNDGGVAVWTGHRWCVADRSVVNVLNVGVASADGRTLYFGTTHQGDVERDDALLVRVSVGD